MNALKNVCKKHVGGSRRCLTLQPPSPEDKLATLSDIAQEYSVEWDAHAAATEMLPPSGAQPRYPGGPLVRCCLKVQPCLFKESSHSAFLPLQ